MTRSEIDDLMRENGIVVVGEAVYVLVQLVIEKTLAQPEQEFYPDWNMIQPYHERIKELETALAQPRKPWVGLTSEDWENTPTSDKQGCERDAELFDWIEQTLKDKNDTF